MPPRKSVNQSTESDTQSDDQSVSDSQVNNDQSNNQPISQPVNQPALPPIKINIADHSAVRNTLDEAIVRYINQSTNQYQEDHTVSNWKLILGFIAVFIALLANLKLPFNQSINQKISQSIDLSFLESKPFMLVAVVLYFTLSGAVQMMHWLNEKDCVCATLPKKSSTGDVIGPALSICASMERYATDYHVTIKERKSSQKCELSRTLQITDYFDTNGLFLSDKFNQSVNQLMTEFEKKQSTFQTKKSK